MYSSVIQDNIEPPEKPRGSTSGTYCQPRVILCYLAHYLVCKESEKIPINYSRAIVGLADAEIHFEDVGRTYNVFRLDVS